MAASASDGPPLGIPGRALLEWTPKIKYRRERELAPFHPTATPVKTGKIAAVPFGRFVEMSRRPAPPNPRQGSFVATTFPEGGGKRPRIQVEASGTGAAANSTILQRRIDKRVKQRKRRAQRASRKRKDALDMLDLSLQLATTLSLPKSEPA